jgi:hypothetical protein
MVIQRKLTAREEIARQNLIRIFQEAKNSTGLKQQDVNHGIGWTGSVFGQFIQGRLALSPRSISKLAEFFKVWPADIDPELANDFKVSSLDSPDIMSHLERLSPDEVRAICFSLSKQLQKSDVALLLQLLADRLTK